ncbi:MAG: 2-succinyl-5-enolpyruvyl-6-hydroxy-3-cyclohexene-1-carboxylic-acid synthase [Myxococcales bacterium]|nr:2-succinyl-5-enolpyruvyl-6-hydroxy-3-cyclohexene-1-carboxylic-acid synthase [Myxococcales bacterium]
MVHGGVLLDAWCTLLLDGIVSGGATEVVVSPGSRSTPLVLAASDHAALSVRVVVDERSAAFFALGRARVTQKPVILIRTSGTAAGHDLPAVMEAGAVGSPLVIITADRPFELMDVRAPQTTDQTHLFGRHTVAFFEAGTPVSDELALRAVRRLGTQAAARSRGPVPGPVQVNVRARKPLTAPAEVSPVDLEFRTKVSQLQLDGCPTIFTAQSPEASALALERVAEAIRGAKRPLLVAGPSPVWPRGGRANILQFVHHLGVPVVLEATSQLRFGPNGLGPLGLDMVLRVPRNQQRLQPDLILQLGEPPIVTGLQQALDSWRSVPQIVLTPRGYPDPTSRADIVEGDIERSCCALMAKDLGQKAWSLAYLKSWAAAADQVRQLVNEAVSTMAPLLTEAAVVEAVRQAVPPDGRLMVGNSLAVRLLDRYLSPGGPPMEVLHQRGISGIDGLVAGGIGASVDAPCLVLVGDVSALHDLGSLSLAHLTGPGCIVVVIHNGGGRLFEELPLARQLAEMGQRSRLDRFTTPSEQSLVGVAEALGWRAVEVNSPADLKMALHTPTAAGKPLYIEARVDPLGAVKTLDRVVKAMEESE